MVTPLGRSLVSKKLTKFSSLAITTALWLAAIPGGAQQVSSRSQQTAAPKVAQRRPIKFRKTPGGNKGGSMRSIRRAFKIRTATGGAASNGPHFGSVYCDTLAL